MRTSTFNPFLTVAAAGALVLACGGPDRTFLDPDAGNGPTQDSSPSADTTFDRQLDVNQQPDGGALDGSIDAGNDARADTGSDVRLDTGSDARDVASDGSGPDSAPDSVSDRSVVDVPLSDVIISDLAIDDAPTDVTVSDVGSDGLDCTGTTTPRISPAGGAGFCPGKTVALTSSTAPSYLWSTNATTQTIDVGVAGSYTVTTTDARGCMATSAPTVVSAYPTPTASIAPSGPTRFCSGGNVTLTTNSAASYLWSTGATTQSIVVIASGSYTVTTTDANGCTATSAPVVVTVVVPTAGSRSFTYTGAVETFTVPECITAVEIDANGAQGGSNNSAMTQALGGYGGKMVARLTTTAGAVLQIRVGGAGTICSAGNLGGFNGGGPANCTGYMETGGPFYSGTGGGATDVRVSPFGINDRVVVAGGGGGAGYNCRGLDDGGGAGGGLVGGRYVFNAMTCGSAPETPGGGGTQAAGGAGGTYAPFGSAGAGILGFGGSGVATGGTSVASEGGGGGGGYYGGGGGCWHGGGGGSGYVRTVIGTLVSERAGINPGQGSLTVSWLTW
jgi:hypothetical protein